MILFVFILVLEEFGYLFCVVFLLDWMMVLAGLFGWLFILLLFSFVCVVLGIMVMCSI